MTREQLVLKIEPHGSADPLYSQVVSTSEILPQPQPITGGVKQGSVLGPLILQLHVNEFSREIRHSAPLLFSDNIRLACSFALSSLPQTVTSIIKELN